METEETQENSPPDNEPRGNPETDQEAVDAGKEQLDQVSGN